MKSALVAILGLAAAACGHRPAQVPVPTMKPVLSLPVHMLGGASIPVFPVNNIIVEPGTGWDSFLGARREAMRRVDSLLLAGVQANGPEITWISQAAVRRAADQAPAMLTRPDQLSISQLKRHAPSTIPEPLRAQLRQLAAVAAGGRYALVPAELVFVWSAADQRAYADVTIVLADVRLGAISWSSTMRGMGDTPWDAVAVAVRSMFP